ncbi:MAG TPA: hypothetical protein VE954_32420 [Oligoflexus sp.]|uniref:hypothetical protein n=1 Tax=Oligoflexus sp. TaxID=1971216 RepID=UPI002D702C53|nr:hypothetical protein [Oligoflexus sp.]HYX37833.1 hypothetical protein [Oligoflexus sp.]
MMLDRDQLIRRVAEKHRLVLTEDDPLIVSVTLHEVIFEHHSAELIQKMDEQNVRVLSALQSTVANARNDQKAEHERLVQTLRAIHQNNLEEYKRISEEGRSFMVNAISAGAGVRQSSRNAALLSGIFGILFFCANLYLLLMKW